MKMPKRITHEKKLKGVGENLECSTRREGTSEKCGPLVAQLPPSIKFDSIGTSCKNSSVAPDGQVSARDRVSAQVLVPRRRLQAPAGSKHHGRLVRKPVLADSDRCDVDQVYSEWWRSGDHEFKEVQKDKSAEMRTWYKDLEETADSVKGALVFFNNHYAASARNRMHQAALIGN